MGLAMAAAAALVATSLTVQAPAPSEPTVATASDSEGLTLSWTAEVAGKYPSAPVVSDGMVFVASKQTVAAFPVRCGTAGGNCTPLWVGRIPGRFGTLTVSDGAAYVGSANVLAAFSASCRTDGGRCLPIWEAHLVGGISAAPQVTEDAIYLTTYSGEHARLYAFQKQCRNLCQPTWFALSGQSLMGSPVVSSGIVFVSRLYNSSYIDNELHAYSVSCGSHGERCEPIWVTSTGGSFGGSTSPRLVGQHVVVGSGGYVWWFRTRCRPSQEKCRPSSRWKGGGAGAVFPVVVRDENIYAVTGGTLHAFSAGCALITARCVPAWNSQTSEPLHGYPAISEDTVFMPTKENGLYAFPTDCATTTATCGPIWSGSIPNGDRVDALATGLGLVFVVARRGGIFAFPASCEESPCGAIWQEDLRADGPPVTSEADRMVFLTSGGLLYAFEVPPT